MNSKTVINLIKTKTSKIDVIILFLSFAVIVVGMSPQL